MTTSRNAGIIYSLSRFEFFNLARMAFMVVALFAQEAHCAGPNKSKSADTQKAHKSTIKKIQFTDQSIGSLYVIPVKNSGNPLGIQPVAVGRGSVTVTVPPGMELLLRSNALIVQKPELLDSLPPDAIDALEIRAPLVDIDDASNSAQLNLMSHIVHLTGLKRLNLYMSLGDRELAKLKTIKHLERLMTIAGTTTGACWKELRQLPDLKQLDFSDNPIKTENLHYLNDFPSLEVLILHRCGLTDQSVIELHNLRHLTNFSIPSNGKVTDASMKYVAQMKNLTWIDLYDTGVTIEGLTQVATLPKLAHVQVRSFHFPEERLRKLQREKPKLNIQVTNSARPVDKDTKRIFAPL